jgi:tyramine---L-glutamate ligase
VSREDIFVIQPYLPGEPMSASFLVDTEGRATLLAIGRQRVEVNQEGRISYQGGTILGGPNQCPTAVNSAIDSVVAVVPRPGLRGFIGVDFLLDDRGQAVILEINPRPTTSFVGLAQLWPAGTIAGAWLAACIGPLEGTDWPDRIRQTRSAQVVSFDADGTIHPEGLSR